MECWQLEDNMVMGVPLSHRPSYLMDNCDLPPPLKLFSPKAPTTQSPRPIRDGQQWADEMAPDRASGTTAGLVRALRLSQTRAREAEKKALLASEEKESAVALLAEESMRLYAHRQWVKMFELQVSMLQHRKPSPRPREWEESAQQPATSWSLALAVCLLGVASVFALRRCFT